MLVKEIDLFEDIFRAYPHQKEIILEFFSGNYRYFMDMIHRRGGKDAVWFNIAWLSCAIRPGNYVYTLPKIGQARNVIWEGKDLEGKRWLDLIPVHLVRKTNGTECKIYFNNGSILHITGADSLMNSHLGSNLMGFVMSEFHKTHPAVWDYVRPIIKRSNGWAAFLFTAYGKGHSYRLFEQNKGRQKWLCRKLTVEDTRDNDGNYIFSPDDIQEERDSGMDEDLIQQEYYCSSDVAVKGTFFADEISLAYKQGRIRKVVVDPLLPVFTSWDIGSRDTNSIWWFQYQSGQFAYFHHHDKNYGNIEYYFRLLQEVQQRFGFRQYKHHFLPHDVSQTEWTTGKTRLQALLQAGLPIMPVPRLRVIERVQVARGEFGRCIIDPDNCRLGLEALNVTRSKYDPNTKSFVGDEVHDWSSHAAAAFEYGLVGWSNAYNKEGLERQKAYARMRK